MKYRKISNTDLDISVIILGTWVFGGEMWGGSEEKGCVEAVNAALDSGVNIIDTAPVYGWGMSEKIIGRTIRPNRDKVILATKCGLRKKNGSVVVDLSPKSIEKEIGDSLRRLQTDRIDLYQCHWPDPETPIEKTMAAMDRLKQQGKIRYIGLSNHAREAVRAAGNHADIITLQDHYSLLERTVEDALLPFLKDEGLGMLAYGPLGGGILSGKYTAPVKFKGSDARKFFYKFYEGKNFEKVTQLFEIFKKIGRPFNQIAINWVRQQPGVTSAIVGSRNPEQVKANIAAADWDLSVEELSLLNGFKL